MVRVTWNEQQRTQERLGDNESLESSGSGDVNNANLYVSGLAKKGMSDFSKNAYACVA